MTKPVLIIIALSHGNEIMLLSAVTPTSLSKCYRLRDSDIPVDSYECKSLLCMFCCC